MVNTDDVLFGIGIVFFLLLMISPFKRICEIIKKDHIDGYNIYPIYGSLLYNVSWLSYAMFIKDIYLIIPQIIAISLLIYELLLLYTYVDKREQAIIRCSASIILPFQISIHVITMYLSKQDGIYLLDSEVLFTGIIARLSHLSKIIKIVREKNSIYIDKYYTVLSLTCAIIWLLYYIYVLKDYIIVGWTIFGITIYTILIILRIIYKSSPIQEDNSDNHVQVHVP